MIDQEYLTKTAKTEDIIDDLAQLIKFAERALIHGNLKNLKTSQSLYTVPCVYFSFVLIAELHRRQQAGELIPSYDQILQKQSELCEREGKTFLEDEDQESNKQLYSKLLEQRGELFPWVESEAQRRGMRTQLAHMKEYAELNSITFKVLNDNLANKYKINKESNRVVLSAKVSPPVPPATQKTVVWDMARHKLAEGETQKKVKKRERIEATKKGKNKIEKIQTEEVKETGAKTTEHYLKSTSSEESAQKEGFYAHLTGVVMGKDRVPKTKTVLGTSSQGKQYPGVLSKAIKEGDKDAETLRENYLKVNNKEKSPLTLEELIDADIADLFVTAYVFKDRDMNPGNILLKETDGKVKFYRIDFDKAGSEDEKFFTSKPEEIAKDIQDLFNPNGMPHAKPDHWLLREYAINPATLEKVKHPDFFFGAMKNIDSNLALLIKKYTAFLKFIFMDEAAILGSAKAYYGKDNPEANKKVEEIINRIKNIRAALLLDPVFRQIFKNNEKTFEDNLKAHVEGYKASLKDKEKHKDYTIDVNKVLSKFEAFKGEIAMQSKDEKSDYSMKGLIQAIKANESQKIKEIIEKKHGLVNEPAGEKAVYVALGSEAFTPLYFAIYLGNIKAVQALLPYVKEINQSLGEYRFTPLLWAIEKLADKKEEQKVIVEALIAKGADLYAALKELSTKPDATSFRALMQFKDKEGNSPLHIALEKEVALEKEAIELAKRLLAEGVGINAVNNSNETPLIYVLNFLDVGNKEHESLFIQLLEKGAGFDASGSQDIPENYKEEWKGWGLVLEEHRKSKQANTSELKSVVKEPEIVVASNQKIKELWSGGLDEVKALSDDLEISEFSIKVQHRGFHKTLTDMGLSESAREGAGNNQYAVFKLNQAEMEILDKMLDKQILEKETKAKQEAQKVADEPQVTQDVQQLQKKEEQSKSIADPKIASSQQQMTIKELGIYKAFENVHNEIVKDRSVQDKFSSEEVKLLEKIVSKQVKVNDYEVVGFYAKLKILELGSDIIPASKKDYLLGIFTKKQKDNSGKEVIVQETKNKVIAQLYYNYKNLKSPKTEVSQVLEDCLIKLLGISDDELNKAKAKKQGILYRIFNSGLKKDDAVFKLITKEIEANSELQTMVAAITKHSSAVMKFALVDKSTSQSSSPVVPPKSPEEQKISQRLGLFQKQMDVVLNNVSKDTKDVDAANVNAMLKLRDAMCDYLRKHPERSIIHKSQERAKYLGELMSRRVSEYVDVKDDAAKAQVMDKVVLELYWHAKSIDPDGHGYGTIRNEIIVMVSGLLGAPVDPTSYDSKSKDNLLNDIRNSITQKFPTLGEKNDYNISKIDKIPLEFKEVAKGEKAWSMSDQEKMGEKLKTGGKQVEMLLTPPVKNDSISSDSENDMPEVPKPYN